MRFKLKLIGWQIFIYICLSLTLQSNSYEPNAVEISSVSYKLNDRGLNDNNYTYLKQVNTKVTPTITPKIKPTPKVKDSKEKCNRWNIKLTNKEIDLLAKILWLEAQGENENERLGQKAVVEVILNRMIHWDFKGSLYDVLSREGAFSTWENVSNAKPTKAEYESIKKVLNGETEILDFDVVYFSTSPRNDFIARHIGGHYFNYYEFTTEEDKR